MAQVYIPENPREREQLQQGATPKETQATLRRDTAASRRFGGVDFILILAILGVSGFLAMAAARWAAPLTPTVTINLSPLALPVYAGYSLLRMILGYLLSLIFTLVYGHIAATNRHARQIMVPLLDILQSVPILSFLPVVLLALVAAFPHSNVGLELASIILIFTSQAWNMTFSFYHSVRTLPNDLREVTAIARLRPWQRFLKLEVPASMIGLIWNSMMSWAGGWFFLMAAEQTKLGSRSFQLPGLGSYLQTAADRGNTGALLLGLLTLIVLIVLLDLLFWRPLVAWADKFKVELSSASETPTSPILDALQRSALLAAISRRMLRPLGERIAWVLNRLQPLNTDVIITEHKKKRILPTKKIVSLLVLLLVCALLLYGLWSALHMLIQVRAATWGTLMLAAGATWLRTLAAMVIGVIWTVPVGVAIRTLTALVTTHAADCAGRCLYPGDRVVSRTAPGIDSLARWTLARSHPADAPGHTMVHPF